MSSGLSEEEATLDFGDVDELIKEILDAYHLNTEYRNKRLNLGYYIQSAADFLTQVVTTVLEMNRRQLGQLFMKALGVALFLVAFRLLLELCDGVVYPLVGIFPSFIARPLKMLWAFVVNLFFAIVCVYLAIFFLRKYVLVDYIPPEPSENGPTAASGDAFNGTELFNTVKQKTTELTAEIKERHQREARPERVHHDYGAALGAFCLSLMSFLIKFIAVLILIPGAITVLALALSCGALIVFIFQGFSLFGLTIAVIGMLLTAIACFVIIYHFVFGGAA